MSLNYTQLDKWEAYGTGISNVVIDGNKLSVGAASKLGPVISFNPIGKLVIDARFQVAYIARMSDLEYSDHSGTALRSFSFGDSDDEKITSKISTGLGTSFGITIRRKAIGLAFDYVNGKVNAAYEAKESSGSNVSGKEKVSSNELQLKLSFTL